MDVQNKKKNKTKKHSLNKTAKNPKKQKQKNPAQTTLATDLPSSTTWALWPVTTRYKLSCFVVVGLHKVSLCNPGWPPRGPLTFPS